jgi:type IV pilus assembly protein PilA
MKQCPRCRKNLADSAVTCNFCRQPLPATTADAAAARALPRARPLPRFGIPSNVEPHTLNPFVLLGRCLHAGGRFSRSEFAVVYLGSIAAFWGLALGAGVIAGLASASEAAIGNLATLLTMAMFPVILIAAIGGGIRRWHDLGKSGWYVLLGIVPCANVIAILYLLLAPGLPADGRRPGSTPVWAIVAAVLVFGVFGVGMIAAIAIPSLLRARVSANESAAIGDLRTLISAQAAYRDANGGHYEGSLECLASPYIGCVPNYPAGGPTFLDAALASQVPRHGYQGRFDVGEQPAIDGARSSPTSVLAWAYVARPVAPGQTGVRSFCGDSSGVICYRPDGADVSTAGGACPRSAAACTPLR